MRSSVKLGISWVTFTFDKMGKYSADIAFNSPAPKPEVICEKASSLCGYPITFKLHEEFDDDLLEYQVEVNFEGFDYNSVVMYAYRDGAVKALEDEFSDEVEHTFIIKTQGYDDRDGRQTVYLEGYIQDEITLYQVLLKTLSYFNPLPDEHGGFEDFDIPQLTQESIEELYLANERRERRRLPLYILYGVLTILWIPFSFLWTLLTLPFAIYRIYRKHPEIFRSSNK